MPGDLPVLCDRGGGGGGGGRQKAVDSGARARPAAAHHTAEESENTLQSVLPRRSTRTVHPSQRVLDEREIERERAAALYTREIVLSRYTVLFVVWFVFFSLRFGEWTKFGSFWRVERVEKIYTYTESFGKEGERETVDAREREDEEDAPVHVN